MVELRTVGQVEISEEATLEELKTQVVCVCVDTAPSSECMSMLCVLILCVLGADPAGAAVCVCAHSCVSACVAAGGTETNMYPQRTTTHTQVHTHSSLSRLPISSRTFLFLNNKYLFTGS